jgi:hypothetical protein
MIAFLIILVITLISAVVEITSLFTNDSYIPTQEEKEAQKALDDIRFAEYEAHSALVSK